MCIYIVYMDICIYIDRAYVYNIVYIWCMWTIYGHIGYKDIQSISGWWFGIPTPLKKYEFVNWDNDIPNCFWKNKSHVPHHQPEMFAFFSKRKELGRRWGNDG